jgi:hypothetical protein
MDTGTPPRQWKISPAVLITLLLSAVAVSVLTAYFSRSAITGMRDYLDYVHRVERNVIERVPIYEDFSTQEKERALRRFLQDDHLRAARAITPSPVRSTGELEGLRSAGRLLKLPAEDNPLYYFYNVRDHLRLLTPQAASALKMITLRFQENFAKRTALPPVKVAVSSAVRPQAYQAELKNRNLNATVLSTHSYGTSFDIFYDEYFVSIDRPRLPWWVPGDITESLRIRSGFLLGASLRRQFRAILMETLIELQEEGVIYAIHEVRQRCYHVTAASVPKSE